MSGASAGTTACNAPQARVTDEEAQRSAADAPVLLEFRQISKSFNGNRVLRGASGLIRSGDVILLEGDNGSGKTTLLNILSGYLKPDSGLLDVRCDGRDGLQLRFPEPRSQWSRLLGRSRHTPEALSRAGVARSWQDIRLFDSLSLVENLALPATPPTAESPWHAMHSRRDDRARLATARANLTRLGLSDRSAADAANISLGQRKRVSIAQALAAGVRILLLDEPLSGLDERGVSDVLAHIEATVRQRHDVALVIIEHTFSSWRLHRLLNRRWMLSGGQVHERTRETVQAQERGGSDRIQRWLEETSSRRWASTTQELPRGARLLTLAPSDDPPSRDAPLLVATGFRVNRGRRNIIHGADPETGLDLSLARGRLSLLLAPNGWGKTTLLECLAGIVPAASGQLTINGTSVRLQGLDRAVAERARLKLSYSGAGRARWSSLRVEETLALCGVTSSPLVAAWRTKPWGTLSGGQRRLTEWVIASQRPGVQLLLLDEPFLGLDSAAIRQVLQWLVGFLAQGGAVLASLPGSQNHEEARSEEPKATQ